MGLSNNEHQKKTFVAILSGAGKFAIRADKDTEGAVARDISKGPNSGKTVYELLYSELSGQIVNISYTKKDIGAQIEVTIEDNGRYVLQIPWASRVRDQFIKRIVNTDLTTKVTFKVFSDKDSGRPVFLIEQLGAYVPMSFTKNNPCGVPQPVQKIVRGEKSWDFTEVENFMFDRLQEVIANFSKVELPEDTQETPDADMTFNSMGLDE